MLDTDIINLGFAGSAKGEPTIVNYLASLDPSVFFIDYDHNSPSEEHLKSTYKPLYDGIRAKHPDTPIVMVTSCNVEFMYHGNERKEIIYDVYKEAIANGDKNLYFIDGATLFENGPEAVIPLSSQEGINYLSNAMKEAGGTGSNINVTVELSGINIADNDRQWNEVARNIGERINTIIRREGSV